ncbi:hypothetical protein [Pseudosulfitobacter pseudonitzschiae]|uniref:hypothetical protein n=1 Tax=Pseudosulfitobacter pseudonitzschiae TaxID=1402135 RepID=UPI001AF08B4C|nr:hypothetical protein [Pseudosulfitobacter pseudonitzschiae]MBM1817182.1 hypothetical protein [Pseudosulfitobacter pseudonitzschiae]MBM1834193.1 hypothetical protein [Pseudosulfitobacter pseudonitzschiae]MBM1839058.1 hypothetical protein [Pseudosulfitobacter pseudonitzschiae]MBM1843906.1 hypothetical protein [Pseudosulfitobacter pseudonitzschiae]MBM1848743.1 hypothetical protein [Pseudosulfitobacter pseudonitzschiae]
MVNETLTPPIDAAAVRAFLSTASYHDALKTLNEAAHRVAKLAPSEGIERESDMGYRITGMRQASDVLVDGYTPAVEVAA